MAVTIAGSAPSAAQKQAFLNAFGAAAVADMAANTGASLVAYTYPGTGAIARRLDEKTRESVSVTDFMTAAQKADVLARTGLIDCLPAFTMALAAITEQGPFVYPVSGEVIIPKGTYFLNGSLFLSSGVRLKGVASGQDGGNWATTLKFPANSAGIVGQKGNTGPDTNGSDGSIIEGLFLLGGGGTSETAHGVDMRSRMKLRDVNISGFAGNGVNIAADSASRTNANNWAMESVSTQFNGLSGVYVWGGDANAGYAVGINASNNNAWGIMDLSFLGNTYLGCHTDGNGKKTMVAYGGNRYYCVNASLAGSTTPGTDSGVWSPRGAGPVDGYNPLWVSGGGYLTGGAYGSIDPNARNLFLGCYSEGGSQPPSHVMSPAMVIGGLHAAGVTGTSTNIVDGRGSISTELTAAGANAQLGTGPSGEVMAFSDPSSGRNYPYRFIYETGKWVLNWGNTRTWLHLYNRDTTPANGFARDFSNGYGGIGLPNGYYGGGMVYRGEGTAAPTTGGLLGDIVYNTSPTAGGFVGWVCTATGTPGTWKTFGAISA